jgi:hypothetical protein
MTEHSDRHDDHDAQLELLDEEARLSRLVVHVGKLVGRGGKVIEQTGYRAIVDMPRRQQMVPNAIMSALAVALFLWLDDPFFLLAAGVALLGWHRKLVAGAEKVRLMVRVDDAGQISERELEPA